LPKKIPRRCGCNNRCNKREKILAVLILLTLKGVGRKIFRGGATKKDRKIAKKDQKLGLLSLYLLFLYLV